MDVGREVFDIHGSPDGDRVDGSDGPVNSSGEIEDLEEPDGDSVDSEVELDGVTSDDLEVVSRGSALEGEDSLIGEVSSGRSGHQTDIGVVVVLASFLIGIAKGSEASGGGEGESADLIDTVGDSSVRGGDDRIELSSDGASGCQDFVIGEAIVDEIEVLVDGNLVEFSVAEDSGQGGGGKDASDRSGVGFGVEIDCSRDGIVMEESAVEGGRRGDQSHLFEDV